MRPYFAFYLPDKITVMILRTLAILLLCTSPVAAQITPVYASQPENAAITPQHFPSTDTIRAITKLFARRRTGATVGLTISAVSFFFLLPITTAKSSDVFESAKAITILGILPATLSSSKLIRFSKKREAVIIEAYRAGQPLPAYIQRRLISRYFRR